MPGIPLPNTLTGDRDTPDLIESIVNLYSPNQKTLLKTPGINSFSTGQGACRGSIDFNEEHYQISGSTLIKISELGVKTELGTVEGTDDCVLDKTFNFLVIVVKGGKGYSLSTAGDFAEITQGTFKPSIDVCAINQRFVFVPADGGVLFYTDVNTLNIKALNFFDAELLPDKNTGCINLNNDLYVGGVDSFEIFRDIGEDPDTPFLRVDGASVESGYLNSKARYKNTFAFLGRPRDGNFGFHIMASGDAPRVSTDIIDEILNNDYTFDEIKTCTAQRFSWNKTDFVAFRLPRETFLYHGTGWTRIQSGIDGSGENKSWDVNCVAFSYGRFVTGSATDSNIGMLADITLEFGNRIERQINTFIRTEPNTYFTVDNLFLDCPTGTKLVEGSVGIAVSEDNVVFGPIIYKPLAKIGKRQQQVAWRGGVGVFESFLGIQIRTTSDVNFSVSGLTFNG